MSVLEIAKKAKKATTTLQSLPEEQRLMALEAIALAIAEHSKEILEENQKDLDEAKKNNLGQALIDRMILTSKNLQSLSDMCRDVADQEQVVGTIVEEYSRPNGLVIQKQRIPLGVIGMIFESRPNVVVDGAVLAIKSGNAIILKGGKEAQHSNRKLFEIINHAIERILPAGSVSLIETREDVSELLKLHQYIDLMVPRGGSSLVSYVKQNATMPVVAHDKGLCHLYVHEDAEIQKVIPLVLNAKVQRPSACNALESLLLHKNYPEIKEVISALIDAGVEVRGCELSQNLNAKVKAATDEDYDTEYLALIISVKIVNDAEEAIAHIQRHTSHHTEAVLTKDDSVIENFLNSLDASALIVNASTRFNDGGELGLGAELGISTSKLHAYGPMGAKEMTTTRFLVKGSGQIRS
jgi:glutamate-5-semialdehyde dehydrogenase